MEYFPWSDHIALPSWALQSPKVAPITPTSWFALVHSSHSFDFGSNVRLERSCSVSTRYWLRKLMPTLSLLIYGKVLNWNCFNDSMRHFHSEIVLLPVFDDDKLFSFQGMIVRPCTAAIMSLTFSYYTLRPIYPDCEPPNLAIVLLSASIICMSDMVKCNHIGPQPN